MRQQTSHQPTLKDIIYLSAFCIVFYGFFGVAYNKVNEARPIQAVQAAAQMIQEPKVVTQQVMVTKDDPRAQKLHSFLISKNSPLAEYAQLIVSEADKYDIGYTKLVAISGMESSFGNRMPSKLVNNVLVSSYNAWGIGGSDFRYFSDWTEAIEYTSWLLGTHYKTNEYSAIKAKYCPSSDGCNPDWAYIVSGNSNDILDGVSK